MSVADPVKTPLPHKPRELRLHTSLSPGGCPGKHGAHTGICFELFPPVRTPLSKAAARLSLGVPWRAANTQGLQSLTKNLSRFIKHPHAAEEGAESKSRKWAGQGAGRGLGLQASPEMSGGCVSAQTQSILKDGIWGVHQRLLYVECFARCSWKYKNTIKHSCVLICVYISANV